MRRSLLSCALGSLALLAVPALAGNGGNGNGAPSGAHYNLNIIGVENPKTQDLTDSNRHTIFVALGERGGETSADSNIWLTEGPFQVCDGNGFDFAYNCSGDQIGRNMNGAVFQLPCNADANTDYPCDGGQSYTIWARALGTPGGSATLTTCAYDDENNLVCSSYSEVFVRDASKPTFRNVTTNLTTLQDVTFQYNGATITDKSVSVFADELQDYFWEYKNKGLRLLQLRFYVTP